MAKGSRRSTGPAPHACTHAAPRPEPRRPSQKSMRLPTAGPGPVLAAAGTVGIEAGGMPAAGTGTAKERRSSSSAGWLTTAAEEGAEEEAKEEGGADSGEAERRRRMRSAASAAVRRWGGQGEAVWRGDGAILGGGEGESVGEP
jgi:hypothetical protein